jgi:hypothetical protein
MYWGNRTLADAKATLSLYQTRMRERLAAGEPLYLEIDARLGWRLQRSCRHPKWGYTTDALRNRRVSRDENWLSPPGRSIAIAGNSYVHCDETADEDSWPWLIQERLGRDYRIHNLGVTAYSTDQAFLRLEEFASATSVDAAVLTLTTTDIYRNLNMCRAFILNDFEVPLYKPRYVANGDRLVLKQQPVVTLDTLLSCLDDPAVLASLQEHDRFFPTPARQGVQILRRFHLPLKDAWQRNFAEGVAVTLSICDHFIEWCRGRNIKPLLLLLPVYWGAFPAGREFDIIAERYRDTPTDVIDARAVFTPDRLKLPRERLARRFNHYTREVSEWLADHICERLRDAAREPAAVA